MKIFTTRAISFMRHFLQNICDHKRKTEDMKHKNEETENIIENHKMADRNTK